MRALPFPSHRRAAAGLIVASPLVAAALAAPACSSFAVASDDAAAAEAGADGGAAAPTADATLGALDAGLCTGSTELSDDFEAARLDARWEIPAGLGNLVSVTAGSAENGRFLHTVVPSSDGGGAYVAYALGAFACVDIELRVRFGDTNNTQVVALRDGDRQVVVYAKYQSATESGFALVEQLVGSPGVGAGTSAYAGTRDQNVWIPLHLRLVNATAATPGSATLSVPNGATGLTELDLGAFGESTQLRIGIPNSRGQASVDVDDVVVRR